MTNQLLPNQTIGIMGDRISSRYLAQEAQNMGFSVAGFSLEAESPAVSAAEYKLVGQANWEAFLGLASVVTYTDDWLPHATVENLATVQMPQGTNLLDLTDDHALSRAFFEAHAINILPYAIASSLEDISMAANKLGYPVVVKPVYKHGKHSESVILRGEFDLGVVAPLVDGGALIVETWLDNAREFAVAAVRNQVGELVTYPVVETKYDENQNRRVWSAKQLDADVIGVMDETVQQISNVIDYVGAYTTEFFFSEAGNVYVRDVFTGLGEVSVFYMQTTDVNVFKNHLRALTGQALSEVHETAEGILLPFIDTQVEQIYRHWQIKPAWQLAVYHSEVLLPVAGHVLALGDDIDKLWNQIKVAHVWDFGED
ncbi:MAG: ATP-grasp domain-containing protein [Lactobacillaceae bacterium]|nr:ATP-grasp domain-containing protein [Lactobacillaceae bacterium]